MLNFLTINLLIYLRKLTRALAKKKAWFHILSVLTLNKMLVSIYSLLEFLLNHKNKWDLTKEIPGHCQKNKDILQSKPKNLNFSFLNCESVNNLYISKRYYQTFYSNESLFASNFEDRIHVYLRQLLIST